MADREHHAGQRNKSLAVEEEEEHDQLISQDDNAQERPVRNNDDHSDDGSAEEELDDVEESLHASGSPSASAIFPERPQGRSAKSNFRMRRRSPLGQAWEISKEALPTLVLSLLSLMFSGELLIHLARWPVFVKVDKLFILVPILLNLKGNLEMNLSLRMSTSANIGELDIRRTRETLIVGNMTLLQVQALIVSAGAGVLAFLLGLAAGQSGEVKAPAVNPSNHSRSVRNWVSSGWSGSSSSRLGARRVIHGHPKTPVDPALRLRNGYFEFVLVLATAMLSASLSSAILGNFMCALVVVARRTGANPDNIASPLAASLGDLLTLTIVGLLGSTLVRFEGTILATLIFIALLVACAVCFFYTRRNTYVRELLSSGWVPLILAMFISSGAGLVLDSFVQRFEGFALLTPVVTGLPGACAAILVSRTSTTLHSGKGDIALGSVSNSRSTSLSRRGGTSLASKVLESLRHAVGVIGRPVEGWMVPCTLVLMGATIEYFFLLFVWLSGQMTFGWPFALAFALVGVVGVSMPAVCACTRI